MGFSRDRRRGQVVQVRERAIDPDTMADVGKYYTKDVTGNTEAFYKDSDGNVVQLTNAGAINVTPGAWTSAAGLTELVTPTDNVTIGSSTSGGKLFVDGDTDEIQAQIQAHSTQTSNILEVQDDAGTSIWSVSTSNAILDIDTNAVVQCIVRNTNVGGGAIPGFLVESDGASLNMRAATTQAQIFGIGGTAGLAISTQDDTALTLAVNNVIAIGINPTTRNVIINPNGGGTADNTLEVQENQNNGTFVRVTNSISGTAGRAGFVIEHTGTANSSFFLTSPLFTPASNRIADALHFETDTGVGGGMRVNVRADAPWELFTNNTKHFEMDGNGNQIHTQTAETTGSPTFALFTCGAHTGLDADTEARDFDFNMARTVEFTAGTGIVKQRAFYCQAPTYDATAAETITEAGTFVISGAPIQTGNMTITNSYALWVESGQAQFDGAIQQATGQKFGVLGATAAIQQTLVALVDNSGGTANGTIAAITQAANAGSADVGPTADAIADLAAQVESLRDKVGVTFGFLA